ncbi:MAG: methyltransferase domain-containing protein [Longimicrobiaceae bacterium]
MADADALQAAYAADADAKEARIAALLEEGGFGGTFRGMRRTPVERGYRMRASVYLGRGAPEDAMARGVDPRGGRVPLEESLWVLPEAARPLVREVTERLAAAPRAAGATGFEVRLEFGGGRAHVTVAAERGSEARLDGFCAALLEEVDGILGIAVPSQGIEAGETHLRHVLLGKTILSHHLAFFQTNRWLTPELAAAAKAVAADPSHIIDLYCGVGLHSVLAAGPESAVVGVDTNRWAIESAVQNAELHGLARARFERIPVERLVGRPETERPSVVYVNPSRYGCAPGVAERVAAWRPEAVCLVSCSIESHARDLGSFARAGYRPDPFECFDMFPFSPFVESVTVLRREA